MTDREPVDIPGLAERRAKLDDIDLRIIDLLVERGEIVQEIGALKAEAGVDPYQPARHTQVLDSRTAWGGERGLNPAGVRKTFAVILDVSVSSQRPPRPAPQPYSLPGDINIAY